MNITTLQRALRRAAGVLQAAGAKQQAQSVQAVVDVLEIVPDASVEDFVANTTRELSAPELKDMSAAEVSARLQDAGVDESRFEALIRLISHRSFDKSKAIQVAVQFTGARSAAWSTKPQALKAIKLKFDERVFLDAKSRHNERVTPW